MRALVLSAFFLAAFQNEEADLLTMRFGFVVNLEAYPQSSPQEALKSLLKAYDNQKLPYLLAHLADPKFVDDKVADYVKFFPKADKHGQIVLAFNKLLKETQAHFLDEPQLLKELRMYAEKAEWEASGDQAIGTIKGLGGRQVTMRKHLGRWFFENKRARK